MYGYTYSKMDRYNKIIIKRKHGYGAGKKEEVHGDGVKWIKNQRRKKVGKKDKLAFFLWFTLYTQSSYAKDIINTKSDLKSFSGESLKKKGRIPHVKKDPSTKEEGDLPSANIKIKAFILALYIISKYTDQWIILYFHCGRGHL